jgi:hypothetical protein
MVFGIRIFSINICVSQRPVILKLNTTFFLKLLKSNTILENGFWDSYIFYKYMCFPKSGLLLKKILKFNLKLLKIKFKKIKLYNK